MQAKFVGRWVASGNNMTTGYPGSSFSFKVSSTHNVTITTSGASRVAYRIDDGSYVKASSGTVTITGLTLSTHTIKVVLTTAANTWLGANYATVSNITVDSDGQILADNPSKRRILVFGDSISAGNIWLDGVNLYAPEYNYCSKLSDLLNTDITVSAFGGIGYVTNANGGVPKLTNEPSYIENINSTLVNADTNFDIILILLGVNDGKSTSVVDNGYVTAVTGCITRIKAKYPSADIHALIPFNNNGKPSLEQVYNAQGVHIVPQTWYSQITFGDALHPNANGHTIIANNLKSYFENYYGSAYFKEAIMKRIDSVYISTNGTVEKITGTMATTPTAPAIPAGGIKICEVEVEQGASNGSLYDKRQMEAIYPRLGVVSVKDFGAVGNGIVDDTAAIQRAIDNNPNTTIYFPKGVYLVSQTIITRREDDQKVYLELDMKATVKATSSFNGDYIFYIAGSGTETPYRLTHLHTGIHGGVIDCNGVTGGIRLGRSHEAMFDEIFVINCPTIGMYIEDSYSADCYVDKVMFYGVRDSNNNPAAQIGLLVEAYDSNINHIRTCDFDIGVKVTGGGNWITEAHVLWAGFGSSDATKASASVGYDIYGQDTYLINCYQDKFGIGIYIHGGKRVIVETFFDFHSPISVGDQISVKNDGDINFYINDLQATFNNNSASRKVLVAEHMVANNNLCGINNVSVISGIRNLTLGISDPGISSEFVSGHVTFNIQEDDNWDSVKRTGLIPVTRAHTTANGVPNINKGSLEGGVLIIDVSPTFRLEKTPHDESNPSVTSANSWLFVRQRYFSERVPNTIYERTGFGFENPTWTSWRTITNENPISRP